VGNLWLKKGGEKVKKYELQIELLEEKIAPIGLSQWGQLKGGGG
jgi:hypothetical protein